MKFFVMQYSPYVLNLNSLAFSVIPLFRPLPMPSVRYLKGCRISMRLVVSDVAPGTASAADKPHETVGMTAVCIHKPNSMHSVSLLVVSRNTAIGAS